MTWGGLQARAMAAWHALRGHHVEWRVAADLPICAGDIVCETCHLIIWCRAHDVRH